MVCTVSNIKNSDIAADYFAQTDDYYREDGHAPTAWAGRGAEVLGLRGEVSTEQAKDLLNGRLPDGEQIGGDKHRPGWDTTFSAPKSVSVAAYVHGDHRLIAAHDSAVKEAIRYLEREGAATRIREGGEVRTVASGNLVIATYRHDTSREGEPQLHTHGVVMNFTQSEDGRWRSLESSPIYRLQKEAGAVYRAALSRDCEKLGWTIEKTTEGGEPSFEIGEVSQAERELFSTRSKQVEAELAKIGKTRESASAAEKQFAALNTRRAKQEIDRETLLNEWREQSRQAGFQQIEKPQEKKIDADEYKKRADEVVKAAVEHLSERESRFTSRQIAAEARKIGMGRIAERDICVAIERAADRRGLARTETRQFDAITGQKQKQAGWTTREAQQTELKMLAHASRAAGTSPPAMSAEAADRAIRTQEEKTGFTFNEAQADATRAVLAGQDRVTLLQGYAGTAKTTSVLAASADSLRRQGHEIIALAPTHSAAKTLGDSIGAESQTVAKFLNSQHQPGHGQRVYVVDEASMLSARDMEKLLARTQDGRLILVGDVKQLGSVEAGAAFRQLQTESKLKTQALDQIVRQRNDELKQAVYDAIRGDARSALSKVEVRELETREQRVQAIAQHYTSLTREEREKTIIIAPGRDDRREINEAVRAELKARGELGNAVMVQTLDRKDLTRVEAARAASYAVGDHVQAGRDYQSLGLKKGESAHVVAVDVHNNKLTIENSRGEQKTIDPAKYTKLQAFEAREMQVAVGDRLVNRENTDQIKNGVVLHVEKIDKKHIHARDDAGKLHKLDLNKDHRLDHGYAQTGHESQGRTCERVLFHAESSRTNLMTQQNFYVPISRAKDEVVVFTDSREKLAGQIERESGQKETALEHESESDIHFRIRNGYPNPKHVSESEMDIRFGKLEPTQHEPAPWDAPAPAPAPDHDRDLHILEKAHHETHELER